MLFAAVSHASDMFASVIQLSDATMPSLHQVEIWELAVSVKRGSSLENRDILAGELVELGDMTRDMKDKLIGINSQVSACCRLVCPSRRLKRKLYLTLLSLLDASDLYIQGINSFSWIVQEVLSSSLICNLLIVIH